MRKGLDVLLDAARLLLDRSPVDAHFVIAGERLSQKREALDYEAALHAAAARTPLTGRVHFLGLRDDVDRLLCELTLLVHAARQEPLGRVLLEAAATGTPVVASDVGGTREILPDDTSARIVPAESPVAVADAIEALLLSAAMREALSGPARRRVEKMFNAQMSAAALAEQYRACLE